MLLILIKNECSRPSPFLCESSTIRQWGNEWLLSKPNACHHINQPDALLNPWAELGPCVCPKHSGGSQAYFTFPLRVLSHFPQGWIFQFWEVKENHKTSGIGDRRCKELILTGKDQALAVTSWRISGKSFCFSVNTPHCIYLSRDT